ncbi:MAG: hypothetical protein ACE5IP_02145 [Terriglobia bacterium]
MMTVEELGRALLEMGFARGKVASADKAPSYIYRTGRVALALSQETLEHCFEPPHQDEAGAPWAVLLKLEVRWLHAADIFRKNGLPVHRIAFEQYLDCLAKIGVFLSPVEHFYEFERPELLDVALSVNTRTLADELTAEVVRERLQPMIEALVRVETFLVFAASLDVLRHELHQKAEEEKLRLPIEG